MIDQAIIDELKAKHGEVFPLKAGSSEAVFRPMDPVRYRKFMQITSDPLKRDTALDHLVRDCLVHPDRATFEAMLARKPLHAARFAEALLKEAGAEDEAELFG